MGNRIHTHKELDVYQMAFEAAMMIFEMTTTFSKRRGTETQVWLDFSVKCKYLREEKLVRMMRRPEQWKV